MLFSLADSALTSSTGKFSSIRRLSFNQYTLLPDLVGRNDVPYDFQPLLRVKGYCGVAHDVKFRSGRRIVNHIQVVVLAESPCFEPFILRQGHWTGLGPCFDFDVALPARDIGGADIETKILRGNVLGASAFLSFIFH